MIVNGDMTTLNHFALGLGITACSFSWQLLVFEHHQHVSWRTSGFLCILFYYYFIWMPCFKPESSHVDGGSAVC